MKKVSILLLMFFVLINNNINASDKNSKSLEQLIGYKHWKSDNKKKYPTKKGTILVTPDRMKGIVPLGHAGIIYDKNNVLESNIDGVWLKPNNWHTEKNYTIGLEVINVNQNKLAKEIEKFKNKYLKKKYNFNFFNTKTRNTFYCSQLVWAFYNDIFGINLDTDYYGMVNKNKIAAIHPLELVASKFTKKVFFYDNPTK
jgi:uncharacterized protein YycO